MQLQTVDLIFKIVLCGSDCAYVRKGNFSAQKKVEFVNVHMLHEYCVI